MEWEFSYASYGRSMLEVYGTLVYLGLAAISVIVGGLSGLYIARRVTGPDMETRLRLATNEVAKAIVTVERESKATPGTMSGALMPLTKAFVALVPNEEERIRFMQYTKSRIEDSDDQNS